MSILAMTMDAYLAIGAGPGFFAGLLGVGGGVIMVPALVILFEGIDLPRFRFSDRSRHVDGHHPVYVDIKPSHPSPP